MAKVLILGGGFGGVVAAESLVQLLGDEHEITLVSRSRKFVFYPSLVRLAFGKCRKEDVSFDLRHAMLDRRVNFIEAEVAHIDPFNKRVTLAHGDVDGKLPYDYLIFALGRRLATEQISGFFENAHHLLNVGAAIQFGKAIANFHKGRAVIGQCEGARLPIPVYETAFALADVLEESGERDRVRITLVSPNDLGSEFGDEARVVLNKAIVSRGIEVLNNSAITRLTQNSATTDSGDTINFDLLMLLPPFRGSSVAAFMGSTGLSRYVSVDWTMRVFGHKGIYAIGDCVDFDGPKLGHMAVRQAEVAAANVAAEIEGHEPISHYFHDLTLVIDNPGDHSVYVHKNIWTDEPATVRQGRFWSFAKRVQQKYWELSHS